MFTSTFSIPTPATALFGARYWWATGGKGQVRKAFERGAEVFSNALTAMMLDAIESGQIARRWWENGGKDQAREAGWAAVRGLAMLIMGIACLLCVAGFGLAALWQLAKRAPAQLEYALSLPEPQDNDGGWGGFGQLPAIPTAALTSWATERFGLLQGAPMTADEALAWARQLRG